MIGKTKIELTDVNTGEVKVIESENMVTEGFQRLIKPRLNPPITFFNVTNGSPYASTSQSATGGLFLLRDNVEELASNYLFPTGAAVTGRASAITYSGVDTQHGSLNNLESDLTHMNDYIKWVWDFSPSQANGQISCVCLTTEAGARIGFGSDVQVEEALKYKKLSVYDAGRLAFPGKHGAKNIYNVLSHFFLKIDDSAGKLVSAELINNQPTRFRIVTFPLDSPTTTLFSDRTFGRRQLSEDARMTMIEVAVPEISSPNDVAAAIDESGNLYVTQKKTTASGAMMEFYKITETGTKTKITITNTTGADVYTTCRFTFSGHQAFQVRHGYVCLTGAGGKVWAIKIDDNTEVFNFKYSDGSDVISEIIKLTPAGKELLIATSDTICDVRDAHNCKKRIVVSYNDNLYAPFVNLNVDGTLVCVPYFSYLDGHYFCYYYNPFLLITINNLAVPVEKTASQSMRVTYTLMREGYTQVGGE